MKISIVTVVFNGEQYIEDCIRSVVCQDYPDIEYIIIDGLSTDRTVDIIERYRNHIQFLVSEKDSSMYEALNKGIRKASGDIVGVLNSDDYLAGPHVISAIATCFQNHNCDAVYGNLNFIRRDNIQKIVRRWRSGPYNPKALQFGWMPAHPTFYVKKSVYSRLYFYRLQFGVSADYELILRFLFTHRVRAVFIDQLFINMRSGGMSNGSWLKQSRLFINDFKALRENKIPFPVLALLLKKVRKIRQFF